MNIIAPCPQKPKSLLQQDWNSNTFLQQNEVDDASFELRQILQCQGGGRHCATLRLDDPIITRTNNPLPLDSSFVPLQQQQQQQQQQPLSQNHPMTYQQQQQQSKLSTVNRPRSLSVGVVTRPMNLVH